MNSPVFKIILIMYEDKSNGLIYSENLASAANYLINQSYRSDQVEELEAIVVMLSNLERLMDQSRVFVSSEDRKVINIKLDNVRKHISIIFS